MAGGGKITIHGPGVMDGWYNMVPQITGNVSWTDVVRTGNTVSCTISLTMDALLQPHFFGYSLNYFAQIDEGAYLPLFSKGSSPMNWNAGQFSGSVNVCAVNTGTVSRLKIILSSDCGCPGSPNAAVVWYSDVPAPSSGYTVTFVDWNGTVLKTQVVSPGGSATPPSTPYRSGYTFSYWSGTYRNVNSNSTVTAVYDIDGYTVRYALNGGSGTFNSQTKIYGTALTLRTGVPTKTIKITFNGNGASNVDRTYSLIFSGWRCSYNNQIYYPGGTYNVNAGCTMTAIWTAISVNPNDYVSPTRQLKITADWKDTVGTKRTYNKSTEFDGWSLDGVGNTRITSAVTVSANLTFYANWKPVKILPVDNPTNGSSVFKGWYKEATYKTKIDANTTTASDITIYALWEINITFNGNGGTLYLSSFGNTAKTTYKVEKTYGVDYVVPNFIVEYSMLQGSASTPYNFLGWNTSRTGSGTWYYAGSKITSNASMTLYAVWGDRQFIVKFHDGFTEGSAGIIKQFTVNYGESLTQAQVNSVPIPVNGSKKFKGWRGSWSNITSNVDVVACWAYSPIWIYINKNGMKKWERYMPIPTHN